MGDPTHKEKSQEALRVRALERIEQGLLPRAKPARTWGGRGSGLACNLCDTPILETDPEMELEFDGAASAKALRFHLQCQSAWDAARRTPQASDWIPIGKALPPFDTPVEARLNMGTGRSVILGVSRLRGAGEGAWLNATTHTPLPETWRPVEWRYPMGFEASEPIAAENAPPKRA